MNAQTLAHRAYQSHVQVTRTPRSTEYQAMAEITHRMKAAAQSGPAGFNDLVAALHDNRRLWAILAADVAGEDNALQESLRAQVFYLAEFTRQHSQKVLRREATIVPLLEINAAVLRGLRGGE